MKQAELTEAALAVFLDAFYAKVRQDPLIGPVFAEKIPDEAWPRHLATIRDFWSSVLLKTGRYKGNPFGRHLGIAGIAPPHFARWLGLFEETAAEVFTPQSRRRSSSGPIASATASRPGCSSGRRCGACGPEAREAVTASGAAGR